MYIFISIIPILGLYLSYGTFRSVLHPHFIITSVMSIMFFSDFIVRGYKDINIENIAIGDVYFYQLVVLVILALIYFASYYHSISKAPNSRFRSFSLNDLTHQEKLVFFVFAWVLFVAEILKRLYFADGSFEDAFLQSFGPRFGRGWASSEENLGDDKFFFAFIGIIFPLSGLFHAIIAINQRGWLRIIAILAYLAVILILIGDGSRTIVIMVIVIPALYLMVKNKSLIQKTSIVVGLSILIFNLASFMVSTRDYGLLEGIGGYEESSYQQDDSYYRTLYALDLALKTEERWDPLPFVGASFLNMIPRVIWPGKPTVDKDYWGNYKEYYVTISFIGEFFALFGPLGGAIMSVLMGIALYSVLVYFSKRVDAAMGLLVYCIAALYVYMVMRSMLNITQFSYMLILVHLVSIYTNRKKIGNARA